jgi:rod shape-determining protein MreC
VLAAFVLIALALLTISFRSPTSGALHGVQAAGSSALRPFQIAATRVAQPFRDAYDYVDGLAKAKSENAQLKKENAHLLATQLMNAELAHKYQALAQLMQLETGPSFPKDYRAVNASVISTSLGPFSHQVEIAAGSSSGIRRFAPVVSGDGLVGLVSNVSSDTAVATLLSDPKTYVPARDVGTNVQGVVHTGPGGTLILDEVGKQLVVHQGDTIITAGTRDPRYPDLYPSGIPIGKVTYVNATDTASFLQVQVQPFANLGSLDAVAALVRTTKHR